MRKLIAPITISVAVLGVVVAGFFTSAVASTAAVSEDGSWLDLARPIYEQIMAGHFIASAAAALILAVALAKRYLPGKAGEFVHSDAGGALTTFALSLAGAVFTATVGGAAWQWSMLTTALSVAFYASGGYVFIKKVLVEPLLKPLAAKAPSWLQPLFQLVFWIFDRKASGEEAIKEAELAGQKAVQENPASGVEGVVGKPTEL